MAKHRRAARGAADDAPKGKLDRKGIRELAGLFRYVRPHAGYLILGLVFLALSSATTLMFPAIIGGLVDTASKDNTLLAQIDRLFGTTLNASATSLATSINSLALVLVVVLVSQSVFSFLRIVMFVRVGEYSLAALRKDLYSHIIQLPMSFFTSHRVGELSSRLSNDVSMIYDTFTYTLAEMLRGLASLTVGVAVIFYISTELSLVMLASFPLLIVVAIFLGRYIRKISKEAQDRLAESQVVVEESLQGIQAVKSYANEWYERKRYETAIEGMVKVALKGGLFRGAFVSFVIFALFGSIVLVLWYGSQLVASGEITVGQLTSFLIYTMFVGAAIGNFGELYAQVLRTVGATERIRELMGEATEPVKLEKGQPRTQRLEGRVVFEEVMFGYQGDRSRDVLKGISFSVKAGEKVALVGPSGAGKSTLISLLLRFYQPQAGRILLDGRDMADLPLSELRAQMAIVPQEVLLFGGTIRENIAYGRLDATEAEILEAARKANALEFIQSFPDGLSTIVGERGVKLSGGQRQRIAIARAVLKDPAILLLDEATSSLDSESEHLVQQALDELMRGRTTFIVAHRLATVRTADQILVLQGGKIVERGRHDELIQVEDGLYRMLASMQFTDGKLQTDAEAEVPLV